MAMHSGGKEDADLRIQTPDLLSTALVAKGRLLAADDSNEEAIDCFSQAISVLEKNGLPPQSMLFADKAKALRSLGKLNESTKIFRDAAEMAGDKSEQAFCLRECGATFVLMEEWTLADTCFSEAHGADSSLENRMYIEEGKGKMKSAQLHCFRDNCTPEQYAKLVSEGNEHFRNALAIAEQLKLPRLQNQIKMDLGWFLINQSLTSTHVPSQNVFKNAISLGAQDGPQSVIMPHVLIDRARKLMSRTNGDVAEAIELLLEAERLHRDMWYDLKGDESLVSYGGTPAPVQCYRLLLSAYLMAGESNAALEALERGRSRALIAELSKKRRGEERCENVPLLDLVEIQACATYANATFVFYAFANREQTRAVAWVVREKEESPTCLLLSFEHQVDAVPFEAASADMRDHMNDALRADLYSRDGKTFDLCSDEGAQITDEEARYYYEVLWKPIEGLVPVNSKIVILPEGHLWNLPFCLLLDAGKQRLVERYTVSLAPSVGVLKLAGDIAAAAVRREKAIVVGNPKASEMCALPGAEQEAEDVERILCQTYTTTKLCGTYATRKSVIEQLMCSKVAHLATHGIPRSREQHGYLPGGIALSDTRDSNGADDFMLFAEEVQNLNLCGLELVVLSCCHGGAGNVRQEGMLGLARAFMFAGCRCVISSRWEIPDFETRLFMVEFYNRYVVDACAPLALRNAQIARKLAGAPSRAWGGFYLLGI